MLYGRHLAEFFEVLAILTVGYSALISSRGRRNISFLIGAASGLEGVQILGFHLATILVMIWLALFRRSRPTRDRWSLAIALAAAVLASTVFTGALVNDRRTGIQLLALALSASVLARYSTLSDRIYAVRGLLATCTVASLTAVAQYAHLLPGRIFEGAVRPRGIYAEPDFMGIFAAIGFLIAINSRLSPRRQLLLVGVNLGALVMSGARAAWLAVGLFMLATVIATLYSADTTPNPRRRQRRLVLGVTLAAGLSLLLLSPSLRHAAGTRIAGAIGSHQDVSANARQLQTRSLLLMAHQAPWYGSGLSASGHVGVSGIIATGPTSNNVASNWILGWWVDGKVLALPLILVLCFLVAFRRRRLGAQVLFLLLINNLFSNTSLFPVEWLAVALAAASPRELPARQQKESLAAHGARSEKRGVSL